MATFLSLARDTAYQSGTISNRDEPSTVSGQTGRLALIVDQVAEAWKDIQVDQPHWRWMQRRFTMDSIVSTRSYDGASFDASRFGRFMEDGDHKTFAYTLYDPAVGLSDERRLTFVNWETFYEHFMWGSQDQDTTGKPVYATIGPEGQLYLHPIPDAAYKVRGWYMRSPQALTDDDDVPELPERFHNVIKWQALLHLGTYDEAPTQMSMWQRNYDRLMDRLVAEQTPSMAFSQALA